jgi:cytochrome b pre-mRNA-processing protein 3
MIFSQLFRPSPAKIVAESLYRCVLDQARHPDFYSKWGVPDSVDGRFEMIVLHTIIVIGRLGGKSATAQALFDLLFADMDLNLRELGVSDISLARHIKRMAKGFLGRAKAYEDGLATMDDDAVLQGALRRNLYGTCAEIGSETMMAMAAYVRRESAALLTQSVETGKISFGEPPR